MTSRDLYVDVIMTSFYNTSQIKTYVLCLIYFFNWKTETTPYPIHLHTQVPLTPSPFCFFYLLNILIVFLGIMLSVNKLFQIYHCLIHDGCARISRRVYLEEILSALIKWARHMKVLEITEGRRYFFVVMKMSARELAFIYFIYLF